MTRDEIKRIATQLATGKKPAAYRNIFSEIRLFLKFVDEKKLAISTEASSVYESYLLGTTDNQPSCFAESTVRRKMGVVRAFLKKLDEDPKGELAVDGETILKSFFSNKQESSKSFYTTDLHYMASTACPDVWTDANYTVNKAINYFVGLLCVHSPEVTEETIITLIADMLSVPYKESTIKRRLSLIRGLLSCAETQGLMDWTIDVTKLYGKEKNKEHKNKIAKVLASENKQGIAKLIQEKEERRTVLNDLFNRLLDTMKEKGTVKALRDRAILCLLADGFTRLAVASMTFPLKENLELSAQARELIEDWVVVRGGTSGPLFTSLDRHYKDEINNRLSVSSILKNVIFFWIATTSSLQMEDLQEIRRYRRILDEAARPTE